MSTTCDAFLGGKVQLRQPEAGYRAGQDPVLLAAAAPIQSGQRFVDLGCGVGAVSLCLAARIGVDQVRGIGVELNPDLAALAQHNARTAGFTDFEVQVGDMLSLTPSPAPWVLSNPPFFQLGAGRLSPDVQRARGRHMADLSGWLRAAKVWVAPRGHLGLVLDTSQVPEALSVLSPQFGGVTLVPLVGHPEKPLVRRCLLFAREGSRSPFQMATPLMLRDGDGRLTDLAQSILNAGASLPLPPLK